MYHSKSERKHVTCRDFTLIGQAKDGLLYQARVEHRQHPQRLAVLLCEGKGQ